MKALNARWVSSILGLF